MQTIEVKLKTKGKPCLCDIEVENISHYRPFMNDNGFPDGTLLYLKGNSKGLEISDSFEEFRAKRKAFSEFYNRLSKLDNDGRSAVAGFIDSILESSE